MYLKKVRNFILPQQAHFGNNTGLKIIKAVIIEHKVKITILKTKDILHNSNKDLL